jgi:tetratricopeptide (TPR) repeat protein
VHLDLQSALVPLGHLERMLESLRAAERLAERLGDESRLGRVHAYMAHCFWWVGEPARAVESCQRSLAIAAGSGDSVLAMVSNVRLGQASFALGRYRQVIQACQAALDILGAESIGNVLALSAIPSVVSLAFMGRCQALLGDFQVGVETGKQAGKLAEQAEHPYSMVIAYWALGDIYVTQGRCEPAIGLLEQAARMCSAGKFALMVPIVNRILGEAYCLWGRGDEGVRLLEGAVQDLAAVKYMPALPGAYASLGEGYLMVGRLEEARRTAERARELCIAHEQEATEAAVVRILGEIGLAQSSAPGETKAFFSEAWARAQGLENRPLMARCALGLSRAERGVGERGPALEHLGVAVQMLTEMGMTQWLHEAQADMASLASTE